MSKLGKILIVVAIVLLAVGVTAALTKGFTDTNPYGWLPTYDKLAEGDVIEGFEFNTDTEIDFAKLINGLSGTESTGQKTYTLLTSNGEASIVVYETIVTEGDNTYRLCVNSSDVYTSENGWSQSYSDGISFTKCKIVSIANSSAISYYIGGIVPETTESK